MGITIFLLPNLRVTSIFAPFFTVISIALVNTYIWDAALFLSIPDHFSTKALLLILVNGGLFWILVKLLPGIEIKGILPALLAPLIFSGLNILITLYLPPIDWMKIGEFSYQQVLALKDYFSR